MTRPNYLKEMFLINSQKRKEKTKESTSFNNRFIYIKLSVAYNSLSKPFNNKIFDEIMS